MAYNKLKLVTQGGFRSDFSIVMRPNLRSYYITELRFSATLTLGDDFIGQIREASPPDESNDSLFVDSYKVDGGAHRAWVWVIEQDKKARGFRIEFNYEPTRGGRLRQDTPRISKLVDIASSIEEEVDISCQVSFRFGRQQKVKPIIPLPMKLLALPDMPFDEIDGLHLVKRGGKQREYDVILGLMGGGALLEMVFFDYHARIRETLADEIIRQAVRISDSFILKEE